MLVIAIVMLLVLGDLAILTFLMASPLSKNSILKQHGLPLGIMTFAISGRRKKNSEIVHSEIIFSSLVLHTLIHTLSLGIQPL
jgi:predicted permease